MKTNKEQTNNDVNISHNIGPVGEDVAHGNGAVYMPAERTWQDMWPKNEKPRQYEDENAYAAIQKMQTHDELIDLGEDAEKTRTWNDMWP